MTKKRRYKKPARPFGRAPRKKPWKRSTRPKRVFLAQVEQVKAEIIKEFGAVPPPRTTRPKYRSPWLPEQLALLGKYPDPIVAHILELAPHTVSVNRCERGIKGIPLERGQATLTQEEIALLGTKPDHVIAKQLGTTRPFITRSRHRFGIPPCGRKLQASLPGMEEAVSLSKHIKAKKKREPQDRKPLTKTPYYGRPRKGREAC